MSLWKDRGHGDKEEDQVAEAEAELGIMHLQVREPKKPSEARKRQGRMPLLVQEDTCACWHPDLGFLAFFIIR